MSERKPVHDSFDAIVDLVNTAEHGYHAYALLKLTYDCRNGVPTLTEAYPLENDLREESDPRIPPYTDFWPYKEKTDVVISGHAYAPGNRPCESFEARVEVGSKIKRVRVIGPRAVRVVRGKPRISPAEPVEKVSLEREEAYGGIDFGTPVYAETGSEAELALNFDHPGIYPRNETGRGYMVVPDPEREIDMPALENPADLLTEDRICTKDAGLWYLQPVPWFLGRICITDFPRIAFLGLDAWYYGPEDRRLKEVQLGWLPENYRSVLSKLVDEQGYDIRLRQEASGDMVFSEISAGTPFVFRNMHPVKTKIEFQFPHTLPRVDFIVEGKEIPVKPKLHNVVCFPAEEKFTLVYGARAELSRKFLPGVHRHIPLAVKIDGQYEIQYETPPTPRELLVSF